MAKKKLNLEENLQKLDDLLEKMDGDDLSLEDSFAVYEEGMKILKEANEQLEVVEKKVQVLKEDGTLEDFDGE